VLSDQVPYFILDLLQQTPMVYVKGLGRFEAIFHPAVVDMPGSRIKPPYIQTAFIEQELEEDTLLTTYIHYVNGANREEIDRAIAAFVEQVKERTAKDEHFVLERFGSFSKTSVGGLRFTPDWDAFNLSFSGLEVIDLRPTHETAEQKQEMPEPYVPAYVPVVPLVEETQPVKEEQVQVKGTPEFVPVLQRDNAAIDETTSRLWWTILASALVLITVLCVYLAWDILSSRKKFSDNIVLSPDTISKVIVTPNPPVRDTPAVEETPVIKKDTEKVTTPAVTPRINKAPDDSFCYVIVGAFKDASNIAKMEERVSSMGYEIEKIAGGALTRVAIKTSCDRQVLQQTLNDARAKLNPEAWIY